MSHVRARPDHFPIVERSEIVNQRSPGDTERSCHQGFVHRANFLCHPSSAPSQIINSPRPSVWHRLREQASVLGDLSNVFRAVGLSDPQRVLKNVMFQYTNATRQVGRFFQKRLRVADEISPFIQVFVAQRGR